MANRHRGEIEAEIGGKTRTLVLTLGALAELEEAFGAELALSAGNWPTQGARSRTHNRGWITRRRRHIER